MHDSVAGKGRAVRLTVRVRPGASRTRVGGSYGGEGRAALCVAVSARAVDGKATAAVIEAVAAAFGVRPRQVRLVSGATARTKVLDVEGEDAALRSRLDELLRG